MAIEVHPEERFLSFGRFRLDLRTGELYRDGQAVKLPPQPAKLLLLLVRSAGELVTREEIEKELWEDGTFVDFEHGINKCVNQVRAALQDQAEEPLYIQTVARRGYRFLGKLSRPERSAWAPSREIALEDLRSEVDSGVAITAKVRAVRRPVPIWAWAAVVALATLVFFRYRSPGTDSPPPPRVVPLTSAPGFEGDPALSPDGRQLAFVTERDLYVKLIDGGQELRLTDNIEQEFRPAWSPDGSRVAFIRHVDQEGDPGPSDDIFVISALGGPEKRLGTSLAFFHGLSWSADGRELAVTSAEKVGDVNAIYLLTVDSGQTRRLTHPPRECQENLLTCGDVSPVFSPDGRTLAFIRLASPPAIYTMALATGELKQLTEGYVDLWDGTLAWESDGEGLVVSLYPPSRDVLHRIAASGGEPEALTWIEAGALSPSISRQGNRMAYEKPLSDWNIWQVPGPRSKYKGAPRRFIASTRNDRTARFSPDGKQIVFVSDRSGAAEVWVTDVNGENARKPFSVSEVGGVSWSPDGRQILFDQYVALDDSRDLFVGSIDGGQLRPLTDRARPGGEYHGEWSGDGRWIYFTKREHAGVADEIWRIPAAGGEPIPVTRGGGRWGRESPDPKYVLFTRDDVSGIWRVPVEGGTEEKLIETIGRVFNRWDVFEKGICYLDQSGNVATLRFHDLENGKVTDLATLDGSFGFTLSVSPGGEWVLVSRQDASGTDLMLVENFR